MLENKKELEDLTTKLEAILSIVKKYQEHDRSLRALDSRINLFCTSVAFSSFLFVMVIFINVVQGYHHTTEVDQGQAEPFSAGPWSRGYEGCKCDPESHSKHQQPV